MDEYDYDELIEKILDVLDTIDFIYYGLGTDEQCLKYDTERKCECKKETLQKK